MAAAMPSSGRDDQPDDGGPRFVFVPGSVDDHGAELSGPVGVGKTHATWPSAPAPRPGSSRPAGSCPTWPAAAPTSPGINGSASSPARPCSSSMTSA
jgi:hypothetical protein